MNDDEDLGEIDVGAGPTGAGDCAEAIHRLYHFLDGELTDQRRLVIQRHLDDCGPCLEAFDFEAEIRVMIAAKCRDEVPPDLRARVAALIDHEAVADDGTGGGPPPVASA